MRSRFPATPVCLVVCLCTMTVVHPGAVSAGQESVPQRPAFHADVSLVTHAVAVLDRDGRPVTGLTAGEFRVYEDGESQEITHFLTPDETPLDVALVLDSSTSLSHWGRALRTSAKTFLTSLDVLDCVYVLPFNEKVGPGFWGRALDPALLSRIDGIFMDGGTALYDAVFDGVATIDAMSTGGPMPGAEPQQERPVAEPVAQPVDTDGPLLTLQELRSDSARLAAQAAAEMTGRRGCGPEIDVLLAGDPQRRRAIVLLTDGADRSSKRRFDEVLALAQRTGIPIFPVVMGEARQDVRLRAVLNSLAGNTGGAILETDKPEELRRAYDDIVIMLRASYLLGYRPEDESDGRWRAVEVRSRRPSYRLVYRSEYQR